MDQGGSFGEATGFDLEPGACPWEQDGHFNNRERDPSPTRIRAFTVTAAHVASPSSTHSLLHPFCCSQTDCSAFHAPGPCTDCPSAPNNSPTCPDKLLTSVKAQGTCDLP